MYTIPLSIQHFHRLVDNSFVLKNREQTSGVRKIATVQRYSSPDFNSMLPLYD